MTKMFYEKHGGWLIPVLCLLVIFQAVILISDRTDGVNGVLTSGDSAVTPVPLNHLIFVPDTVEVVKGESFKVEIRLEAEQSIALGGIDLVIRFDPKSVDLTKVEAEKIGDLVNVNRQSETDGRLFVTYLDDSSGGLSLTGVQKLLTLTITAKSSGKIDLGMITGGEGARTVLTDKTSSQSLPVSVGGLSITVAE